MLQEQLKEDSGYGWVTAQLAPLSPFGKKMAQLPKWYDIAQQDSLQQELNNVALAAQYIRQAYEKLSSIMITLTSFRDPSGSLTRDASAPMDEVELFEIKYFLLHLERLIAQYEKVQPFAGIVLQMPQALLNTLDKSGRRIPTFALENGYSQTLTDIRQRKLAIEKTIRVATPQEKETLLAQRRGIVLEEDAEEMTIRKILTQEVLANKTLLLQNMENIGRLDFIIAKAYLAKKFSCTMPTIAHDKTLLAEDMVHPQVQALLEAEKRSFMPVTISLCQGCTVITGANMGGKSVTLKALTLNILLLHTGFFVFARSFTAPLFDAITLLLADNQSIAKGLSSFGAEIMAINDVIKQAKTQFFFLAVDEFARGTNPQEGAKLAKALVAYLAKKDCISILTTHYDGVAQDASAHYQVIGLQQMHDFPQDTMPLEKISRMMDYRLERAKQHEVCPQDAWKICQLLNLEKEILDIFEENG